jgi:cell wall-associated NlpC family hydrolase
MLDRNDIVNKARECLGTPFKHQGRIKGKVLDCAGLILYVGNQLGLMDYDFTNYSHQPHSGTLKKILDDQFISVQVEQRQIGDILLFTFDREPQHLAIVTPIGIIHSYAHARKCVEHRLDDLWCSRIRAAYQYKGLE